MGSFMKHAEVGRNGGAIQKPAAIIGAERRVSAAVPQKRERATSDEREGQRSVCQQNSFKGDVKKKKKKQSLFMWAGCARHCVGL